MFSGAAIKLLNRLLEEIKRLPDRQFKCHLKREILNIGHCRNRGGSVVLRVKSLMENITGNPYGAIDKKPSK